MAYSFDELAERERRRWMKPNAHLHIRPDAQRFMRPDAARFFHPDGKRFDPDGPEGEPEPVSSSARAYARPPVAIRAPAYVGRPRFARASAPAPGVGPSDREILKLKSDLAALRVHLAVIRHENAIRKTRGLPPLTASDRGWQIILKNFARFQAACRKAGFDPNQPRVPAGDPAGDPDGGQWTDSGGGSGGGRNDPRVLSDATPDNEWKPGARFAQNDSSRVSGPGNSPPPGEPPAIPPQRPPTVQERNNFLKAAAKWMAAALRVGRSISPFVSAYEAMSWLDTDRPFMEAYLDPPKTLEELREAVSEPRSGYHIHHIVEQGPALAAGYLNEQVDAPENLVRIPALKHWEITGWFGRKNENFGGRSPRDYLRDKGWSERVQVGRDALITHGVLMP